MLFRQMFEKESCTYTYLLAGSKGGEALIIDPVNKKTDHYLSLIDELNLKLVKAIDTHVHADHVTALGSLRDKTNCVTVMGKESSVDVVSMRIEDGDKIEIDGLCLNAIHTPGHTNDSYCFYTPGMVFTGDTLFIRGTGRTDFQGGNSADAYYSLFNKLLKLPEHTLVYPGHDYKGDSCSTIGEEQAFNPRLHVKSASEYANIMDNLALPTPKMMDDVIPKNQSIGFDQQNSGTISQTSSAHIILDQSENNNILFLDLRENSERQKDGIIPNSVHVPYKNLSDLIKPGGLLETIAIQPDQQLVFYCAYGERSAMALKEIKSSSFQNVQHLGGGMNACIHAGGTIEDIPPLN